MGKESMAMTTQESKLGGEGPATGESYRVLVVDDEKSVLEVLHDMLVSEGYAVDATTSPAEALQRAKRQKFDAIVLDLYMPEMSGMLFHAKLRLFDPELAERTVFISGYVSREELREHLASTAHYLEKPFKAEDLAAILRQVLPVARRC
jgi:CheY-like chemotaxis protein